MIEGSAAAVQLHHTAAYYADHDAQLTQSMRVLHVQYSTTIARIQLDNDLLDASLPFEDGELIISCPSGIWSEPYGAHTSHSPACCTAQDDVADRHKDHGMQKQPSRSQTLASPFMVPKTII
jgi:hypothetical protein